MGGFRGGGGGRGDAAPLFSRICLKKLEQTVFRVVSCNRHKDVHVLWVWSDVAPNFFRLPPSEFSGSAPEKEMSWSQIRPHKNLFRPGFILSREPAS